MRTEHRFDNRVENYKVFRPSYPDALVAYLFDAGVIPERGVVADVGSGTGIFSKILLDAGCSVFAVEPGAAMRQAAEADLGTEPGFRSVAGAAEATGLDDASVDAVVAAQAFHWFDAASFRTECMRILRPEGRVALIWNERWKTGDAFHVAFEAMLLEHGTDYAHVDHVNAKSDRVPAFFRDCPFTERAFAHSQVLDAAGLLGRVNSCSYVPAPNTPGYASLERAVNALFERCAVDDVIRMRYDARVFLGRLT